MGERPWMPLYVGDYLKDTGHLTVTEHGAYMLLIMRYWEDGGLPADERLIARYSRLSAEQWAESRDILFALFDDGWKHGRIDAEIAKAEGIIEKRRAAAGQRHSKSTASAGQVQSTSSDTRVPQSHSPELSSLRSDSAPAKPTPRSELMVVLDADRAGAVIDHRSRIRKPLTAHAAHLLAGKFAKCPDPNAAADAMVGNGWQGFEPEWLERPNARGSPAPPKTNPTRDVIANLKERMAHAVPDEEAGSDRPPALRISHAR
jgi:uncharacterized protein YdaU (DUF1376 family)